MKKKTFLNDIKEKRKKKKTPISQPISDICDHQILSEISRKKLISFVGKIQLSLPLNLLTVYYFFSVFFFSFFFLSRSYTFEKKSPSERKFEKKKKHIHSRKLVSRSYTFEKKKVHHIHSRNIVYFQRENFNKYD